MNFIRKQTELRKARKILEEGGEIKLHLGCGEIYRDGWVDVDIDPRVKPDIVASIEDLYMFPDDSVDVIEHNHLFEHLSPTQADQALKEWLRVLKKGGELVFEFPNFDRCIEILADEKSDEESIRLAMIGVYGFKKDFEEIDEDGVVTLNVFQMHKWGWGPKTLTAKLRDVGFSKAKQIPVTQKHRPAYKIKRDMRIQAIK